MESLPEQPSEQPPQLSEEPATDMAGLRQRASVCLKCPHLVKSRKNVVFGVGDIHAQLMFVGEAPGADEDAQGEPFVGAAGQLLTPITKTRGLSRERFISPTSSNAGPTPPASPPAIASPPATR